MCVFIDDPSIAFPLFSVYPLVVVEGGGRGEVMHGRTHHKNTHFDLELRLLLRIIRFDMFPGIHIPRVAFAVGMVDMAYFFINTPICARIVRCVLYGNLTFFARSHLENTFRTIFSA